MLVVTKRNGTQETLNPDKINKCVERCAKGLENVSVSEVVIDSVDSLFNLITTTETTKALIKVASSKTEYHYEYGYLAARLLCDLIYKEVFGENVDCDTLELQYRQSFIKNTKLLVKKGLLSPELLKFDLKKIAKHLEQERDYLFEYEGLQVLYDRYFVRLDNKIMETPQSFWMRVAMGLSINEQNKEEFALKVYDRLSQFFYSHSTPTLFNSGTVSNQLSSCFLSTIDDSIDGIFTSFHAQARLSKHAGGLGVDFGALRATGSRIKGTNGASSGIIPWLKIFNDLLIGVNQSSRRKGSGVAVIEPWHYDVEDFIDVKKAVGDDRRRCHDMNTALWCPDLFFEKVEADEDWYLFCPSEVNLHEVYGEEFNQQYAKYVKMADEGKLKVWSKTSAKNLWKKILTSLFETGHPWIAYKDAANYRYSNSHEGIVHNSNLCLAGNTKVYAKIAESFSWFTLFEINEMFAAGENIYVASYNFDTKEVEYKLVLASAKMGCKEVIEIIDNFSHRSIECTLDHEIWTKRGYVKAEDIRHDDKLLLWQDYTTHGVSKCLNDKVDVYDITVSDNHNFYANGLLVSNCHEILLHDKPSKWEGQKLIEYGETAICTLASINLLSHVKDGGIDYNTLADTVEVAIRALDNIAEINYYPIEEARRANMRHRPVGLGVMGWFDAISVLNILFDSEEALVLTEKIQEFISYHAILASSKLAKEKGKYPSYEGSKWSQGLLPIDTYCQLVNKEAKDYETLDWTPVREHVKQYGVRMSNHMAIAPTASIGTIQNVYQSIEPSHSVIYSHSNLSGEFIKLDRNFVRDCEKEGIWSRDMAYKVKMADGDLTQLDIPQWIKNKYKKVFEWSYEAIIKGAAARQRWLDQGQSLNLYSNKTSLKYLNDMYMMAWKEKLKTTYYLRTQSASKIEKSNQMQVVESEPKVCSIDNPDCESCQ